ncbi:S-adenosyl-L-methionine-dependent methyltransferase [Xylariaceae sp. FL0804]|nr:S-adenosyl-L-methionine-dependent methyltransferase [Xylariaceae sp. FL0804]
MASPSTAPQPSEPEPELLAAADPQGDEGAGDDDGDADSALGSDIASSTDSITASILEYRTIKGRTYHSERHDSAVNYITPNDERQMESQDITHHYFTILLDDQLYLAPIKGEDLGKVLDIGTGTGIWAIDLADKYPNAEIIGTDLSPTQPLWTPPNLRFEIDDCTLSWTWPANTFDFINGRYLFGGIKDWDHYYREAFRTLKPGGWMQTWECDCQFFSDDGTVPADSSMEVFWNYVFYNFGDKTGCSMTPIRDDVQRKGMQAAGFVDITSKDYKLPVGPWPADPKLSEVGQYVQLTLLNDIDGYTLMAWNVVMGENTPGWQENLAVLRREIRNRRVHSYMKVRIVYARKPESS